MANGWLHRSVEGGDDYLNPDTAPYIALTATGIASLLIIAVLGTILLSPTVHRNVVAMNVYVCLFIFCLSYFILPLAGEWSNPEPPFGTCIISAMINYASFPIGAASILALSISVWLTTFQFRRLPSRRVIDCCLVALPYTIWIAVMTATFVAGNTQREDVVRHGYPRCFVAGTSAINIYRIPLAVIFLPCFLLLCSVIVRLCSRSSPFQSKAEHHRMWELIIRMCVFGVGSIIIFVVEIALSSQSQFNHAVETISLGFFPLVIVISFGTQREVLRSWKQWGKQLVSRVGLGTDAKQARIPETDCETKADV